MVLPPIVFLLGVASWGLLVVGAGGGAGRCDLLLSLSQALVVSELKNKKQLPLKSTPPPCASARQCKAA